MWVFHGVAACESFFAQSADEYSVIEFDFIFTPLGASCGRVLSSYWHYTSLGAKAKGSIIEARLTECTEVKKKCEESDEE